MLRAARCAAVRAARSPAIARNIATYGAASPMPAMSAAARARRSPVVAAATSSSSSSSSSMAGVTTTGFPRRGFASLKSRTVVEAKAVSATSGVAKHVGEKMETKGAGDSLDDTPIPQTDEHIKIVRNIGISAHIDSGKTTLTERVLYYTGRIREMHEVKGTDGVGATMDSMELERAKGITIKSAATHAMWKGYHINVIDTPGHVDFTIEVERSLRVLDGAVFVLCGVAGVQSQSITVDKQMKRYSVPRVLFINKLDRQGANPWKAIDGCRRILQLNLAAVQIPMGLEDQMQGCIDLITREAIYFKGPRGDDVSRGPVPEEYKKEMEAKRVELIETLASVDEPLADLYLENAEISVEQIKAAIRKHTIGLKFIPVFLGTALKNKGVQAMLDGVVDYLPNPYEVRNYALDQARDEAKVLLFPDSSKPLVALAFKLEEGQYGQLTYMRIYQGTLRKGETITDMTTGQKHRVPRLCRMHSSEMEPLTEIGAGEIAAMAGVDCASGTTFIGSGASQRLSMTSMHIPEPVISLAIKPQLAADNAKFSKAINRFQREDPTFRCHQDAESQETIISGMGELHLQIYAERIAREYNVMCDVGQPQVAYRETVTQRGDFNYTHKKQSGGAGQYGKVVGYVEPLPEDHPTPHAVIYENKCSGTAIPPEFFPAIEKGFMESKDKGPLIRAPVQGVRIVLTDGGAHAVDSSEVAFKLAAMYAMAQGFKNAAAILLEPVMAVEVEVPSQFQGGIVASLNRRRGVVQSVDTREGGYAVIRCDVPLKMMFGYSTDLRSSTEGKGEFSMEYKTLQPVSGEDQYDIIKEFEQRRLANEAR